MRGLPQLGIVTGLLTAAAHSRLADLTRTEQELRGNLAQLDSGTKGWGQVSGFVNAAQTFEAQLRWRKWAEQRRRALQLELSKVMAQKQEAQVALRRALGKEVAVQELMSRQQTAAMRKAERELD